MSDALPVRPNPQWVLTDRSMDVLYRRFNLVDDEVDSEDAILTELDPPAWYATGDGWIALLSGASGHCPEITMEAWDEEPAQDHLGWSASAQVEVQFPGGDVRIWGTTTGSSTGPAMRLPFSEDGGYHLRLAVAAVDDIAQVITDSSEEEEPFYLEQWRFQFWPLRRD